MNPTCLSSGILTLKGIPVIASTSKGRKVLFKRFQSYHLLFTTIKSQTLKSDGSILLGEITLWVEEIGTQLSSQTRIYLPLTTISSKNGIYYSHQNKSQSPCLSLILEPTYRHFLQRKSHLKFQPIPAWIQIL